MTELTAAPSSARKKNTVYYINCVITLALMFAGFLIGPVGPLTESGSKVVFIFVGVVYGMITVGITWPALLGMVLLGFSGYMDTVDAEGKVTAATTVAKVFLNAFGNDTYLFVFFLLIFAAIMNNSGLSNTIAYKMVSLKFAQGKPWVLSLLILVAAYLVGMLISCSPGILIPWAIVYTICKLVGYTPKDQWPKFMVIGIVLAAQLGNAALPFKPLSLQMMASLKDATGIVIDYVPFTIFAIIMSVLIMVGYWAMCRFCFRIDVAPLKKVDVNLGSDVVFTAQQKQLCVALAALFVFLFVPSFLPAGTPVKAFFTTLGSTAVAVVIIAVLALMRKKDGKPYVNVIESIKTGVPWETLILLAFVMVISTALTTTGNGVKEGLSMVLNPVLGSASGFMFSVILLIVAAVGTQVLGNLIYGLMLMPIVCVYGAATGADLSMLTVALCVVLNAALVLPSASPLAGLLHGNTEWVSEKDIYKYSVPNVLVVVVVAVILCATLGAVMF